MLKLGAWHRPKAAQMVIHRSSDEPCEGQLKIVLRRAEITPLEVFQIERGLVIDKIRIGAFPAGGFPDAVQLNHDVMPSGGLHNRLSELDGFLVVMIEKVDHHATPTKFRKSSKRFLDSSAQCGLMHPRP
jgi:hypothetical protein